MTKENTDHLKIKPGAVVALHEWGMWPILKLCNKLEIVKHLFPNGGEGNPALEGFMDPYMHNASAPDYLLGDISTCLMEFWSMCFKKHGKIRSLYPMLRVYTKEMGNGVSAIFVKSETKSTNSMSISKIFRLITLMPVVMQVLQVEVGSEWFSLLNTFARLVGLAFWWPEPDVDWYDASNTFIDLKGSCTLKNFVHPLSFVQKTWQYSVQNILVHSNFSFFLIPMVYRIFIRKQFLFTTMHYSCQI